jgi:hypothetical protein
MIIGHLSLLKLAGLDDIPDRTPSAIAVGSVVAASPYLTLAFSFLMMMRRF